MGSIPGSGRSLGGGHGNPLQYFSLENSMHRGAWRATIHRVTQSQKRLKQFSTHAHMSQSSKYTGIQKKWQKGSWGVPVVRVAILNREFKKDLMEKMPFEQRLKEVFKRSNHALSGEGAC